MRTVAIFLTYIGNSGSPLVPLAFLPWLLSMLFLAGFLRLLLYGHDCNWYWAKWLIVEWRWSSLYILFVFVVHYVSGLYSGIGVFYLLLTCILYIQYEIILGTLYDGALNNFTWRGTIIRSAILIPLFIILSYL